MDNLTYEKALQYLSFFGNRFPDNHQEEKVLEYADKCIKKLKELVDKEQQKPKMLSFLKTLLNLLDKRKIDDWSASIYDKETQKEITTKEYIIKGFKEFFDADVKFKEEI